MLEVDDAEFDEVRAMLKSHAGIHLSSAKKTLVAARLAKRLHHLGLSSVGEYCAHVRSHLQGGELREMINALTTNKTEFFRESHHFDLLEHEIVPALVARAGHSGKPALRIWSAGCSTGQEPYTLAMVLSEIPALQGWDVRILASDIDTRVLAQAEAGVYPAALGAEIPEPLLRKYFDDDGTHIRASRALRDMIRFRHINLIEDRWPMQARFDAIFCRNVAIYFDRETQNRLYERLASQLASHGYLFAGHSENLGWLPHLFRSVGMTVYAKAGPGSAKHPCAEPAPRGVSLRSGEVFASRTPAVVSTLLGSCVAACVFDAEAKVGGINHIVVPGAGEESDSTARYGDRGMRRLFDEIELLGGRASRLRAKVVGGAHVIPLATHVAEDNVRFVREFLAARNVPIVSERVGGDRPLELQFETHTGRAFVRQTADASHAHAAASAKGDA